MRSQLDEVPRSSRIRTYETGPSHDGGLHPISKIPMLLDDATVTHGVSIGEDVTDWNEAPTRIAHSEKPSAIGELAAAVMHEITNPLATIGACAVILGARLPRSPDADAYGECRRIIDGEIQRCKRIIEGLLEFDRPKLAGRTPVEVNAVIEKTLLLLNTHPRFKNRVVHRQLDPELLPGRAS